MCRRARAAGDRPRRSRRHAGLEHAPAPRGLLRHSRRRRRTAHAESPAARERTVLHHRARRRSCHRRRRQPAAAPRAAFPAAHRRAHHRHGRQRRPAGRLTGLRRAGRRRRRERVRRDRPGRTRGGSDVLHVRHHRPSQGHRLFAPGAGAAGAQPHHRRQPGGASAGTSSWPWCRCFTSTAGDCRSPRRSRAPGSSCRARVSMRTASST